MKSNPIFRRTASGLFPFPPAKREDHVSNELSKRRNFRDRRLRCIDGFQDLCEIALSLSLRHFRDKAEYAIPPVPVFPPLTNPHPSGRTPDLLYTTFLKPFWHESIS